MPLPMEVGVTLAICPDDLGEREPWLGASGNCLGSFSDPLISKSASLPAYRRNGLHRVSKRECTGDIIPKQFTIPASARG